MKKVKNAFLLSLFFLLLAGCSMEEVQPVPQDANDIILKKSDKDHYVPFQATFGVYIDLESILLGPNVPLPPPFPPPEGLTFKKYQFVYGEGNASHLGLTNLSIEQWWRPTSPPPPPGGPFNPWSGAGVGEFIFIAANGDILLADYDDAISEHESPTYVTLIYTGRFKDGGTGRFTNAEGEFIWEGEFNPETNFGTVTATGIIKYSR